MAERPGIMLYFDMAEPLKALGYEEKGRLLEAMLDYGQFGVVPEFEGYLLFAWGFIRPKLDVDAKNYRRTVIKNTHSSYCAKEKKNGNNTPLDFEEWCAIECIDTSEWVRTVSFDTERYPTTNTDGITTPSAKSIVETATEGGGKGEEAPLPEKDFETLRREQIAKLQGVG